MMFLLLLKSKRREE